jgi:transposase
MALSYINRLYAIEREVKDAGADERRRVRQARSKAILEQLREWLDKTLHTTLPKGALGKTLGCLNKKPAQADGLSRGWRAGHR